MAVVAFEFRCSSSSSSYSAVICLVSRVKCTHILFVLIVQDISWFEAMRPPANTQPLEEVRRGAVRCRQVLGRFFISSFSFSASFYSHSHLISSQVEEKEDAGGIVRRVDHLGTTLRFCLRYMSGLSSSLSRPWIW